MIRYTLACESGHSFDSWFQNSDAYDKQTKRGFVVCPVCNSSKVEKAIMAPRIAGGRNSADTPAPAAEARPPVPVPASPPAATQAPPTPVAMVSPHERELRSKLRELRDHLVKNADYVGRRFPEEARKMHYGEAQHRSIYGEASADQAKELHEEGIEFHPLPVLPDERN